MTVTFPLPLPPSDVDRRSSRVLSSAERLRSRPRIRESPPAASIQQPVTLSLRSSHSGAWTGNSQLKPAVVPEPVAFTAGNDTGRLKERGQPEHRSKGIASKRKDMEGTIRHHHLHLPEIAAGNTGPKHRTEPHSRHAAVKSRAETYTRPESSKSRAAHAGEPSPAARWAADRGKNSHSIRNTATQILSSHANTKLAEHQQVTEEHRQAAKHPGKSEKVGKEQQTVKEAFREPKNHQHVSKGEPKKSPESLEHGQASIKPRVKKGESSWCRSAGEQDFPDSDHRSIRVSPGVWPLSWFSQDDIQKMELLAGGDVVSKARVPAHGQVLQVALDPPTLQESSPVGGPAERGPIPGHSATHSERCLEGRCSLIKRTDDWYEVFAFHLDRVLGLNRSLPAVLRTFQGDILPYRYTSGTPRPVIWWDPDIQHLADGNNDQNSVVLSWVQYQRLLQVHCGTETGLRSGPCVGVHHSEWSRLALFDFLLQVNDRLDRYCCGFTPDPAESCVENLLHAKCGNIKDLLLVHILVRKADPSRLVFIDNAGRPQQSADNLNFRLVEGIDEFPQRVVSVLQSGCLENLLLRSLYTDRKFWESQGGARGLRPLIRTVEQRGKILLQHIRDKKVHLKRDL
ncbi:Golgi-associated kinase 1A [Aulostomus maculatus]